MIVYQLADCEGETLALNDVTAQPIEQESTTLGEDNFTYNTKIVPRSGQDGAVALGDTLIDSRELTVSFNRAYADYNDLRTKENELLAFLKRVTCLIDVTNNRRISVSPLSYKLGSDPGCYHHSTNNSITFEALIPYWENLTETTVTQTLTGGDINEISLSVNGSSPPPPVITLDCAEACTTLQMYISENKQGIEINDSILGSAGFEIMTVDNKLGTVKISNLDRSQNIVAGTGFFDLLLGASTLVVIPEGDLDITIAYNERYYL